MSLREKIENNLAIWLFGALGTGFLAGLGAYRSIIEIAQLDVISKSRLEELEARCKPEEDASDPPPQISEPSGSGSDPEKQQQSQSNQSAKHSNPEKLQAQPNPTETNVASDESFLEELLGGLDGSTEADEPEPLELRFSGTLPLFPEQFDLVRPEMKLSEARTAYPQGTVSSSRYSVEIDKGPFRRAAFYTFSRGEDPPIESISFYYRSDEARQLVFSEVLRKFGGINHSSESLGTVLRWPDIDGFELEVDEDGYHISRTR